MQQVDAAKKYGLTQSTIATSKKKKKLTEEDANSYEINPQRKRLQVAANENTDAAVLNWFQEMMAASNGWFMCFRDLYGITQMENDDEEDDDTDPSTLYWHPRKIINQFSPYGHIFKKLHPLMMITFVH
ncbi:hypothetical protein AVEN_267608-1 [Araneus ventricosus]|uniref:HTH psq-type domain-containing protein n=1 Tax=Araneus ventricosus TaxID=182803 RepID=A0A4Y2SUI3_ARAVE|nr:hypothetical protein AVEN_103122-1 [Araneus ventricosus]GBN91621.1 hypothetical protein AVEN_267608-1 [Araneus ventricosus]